MVSDERSKARGRWPASTIPQKQMREPRARLCAHQCENTRTHTHTHTYIYIYIYTRSSDYAHKCARHGIDPNLYAATPSVEDMEYILRSAPTTHSEKHVQDNYDELNEARQLAFRQK